jgi:hypothetical protein
MPRSQHQTLNEHLAHDAPTPCSDCQTNREFALALGAACKQEVRDVRAGDEQEQQCCRLPQAEDGRHPEVHHRLRERDHHHAEVPIRFGC